jgi:hypothetical protein
MNRPSQIPRNSRLSIHAGAAGTSPSSHLSAVFTFGEVINSKEILRQRAFADLSVAKPLGKLNKRRYNLKTVTAPFDTGKLRTLFNNVLYSMESRSQLAMVHPVGWCFEELDSTSTPAFPIP